MTIQISSTNLIMQTMSLAAVKAKLVEEIDRNMDKISDDLLNQLTISYADNFDYLQQCYMESLRLYPPAPQTGSGCFSEDVIIGGVKVRARDPVFLNIEQSHHDPFQWQRPDEYLPERFDHADPLYKRPDGGSR